MVKKRRRPRFDPWVEKMPWRRECLPTPLFFSGKSQGQRSLAGYSPHVAELDMTKWLTKITADGDCSHEIKRCLLLGRKVMTNLDSILKSRDITLQTNVPLVKAMVFPVVMCGCESWTVKKAERQKIDAFELWCWGRLLRVPWTARRSNQSILKECSGVHWKWCWSWNSNTLATSCKELTHWKRLWCWEGLEAGGERDDRGWVGWMASPTRWTWVWVSSGSWWWTGRPGVLWFMGSQRVGRDWATELNWTEVTNTFTFT